MLGPVKVTASRLDIAYFNLNRGFLEKSHNIHVTLGIVRLYKRFINGRTAGAKYHQ